MPGSAWRRRGERFGGQGPCRPVRVVSGRSTGEQYRKDSASTATRVTQLTSPVGVLIAAAVGAGHSLSVAVFLGVLAVVLFAWLLALDRRRQHRAGTDGGGPQPGPVPGRLSDDQRLGRRAGSG
jgi:hypothetical protein